MVSVATAGTVAGGGTTKSCVVRTALVCMALVLALALLLRPATLPRPHQRIVPIVHKVPDGPPEVLSVSVAHSIEEATQNPQRNGESSPSSQPALTKHQQPQVPKEVTVAMAMEREAGKGMQVTATATPTLRKHSSPLLDPNTKARAAQADNPLAPCKASLQARECPENPYAEAASEICRPTEPTDLAVGDCHLEPVEVLARAHSEYRWFLHVPPAQTLEPPLVLADKARANASKTPFVPAPRFRSWPAPGPVVLGFSWERSGPHFVDGSNGAVFNATHAYTNKRWHRVPSKRSVNSVLQAGELDAVCSVSSAVREAPVVSPSSPSATLTRAPVVHLQGVVVNLVVVWGDTFQHTVLEVLPRLSAFLAWLNAGETDAAGEFHASSGASAAASTRHSVRAGKVPVTLLICPGSRVLRSMLQALSELDNSPISSTWKVLPANPSATYTADTIIFPTLAGQQKIGVMPRNALCPLVPFIQRILSRRVGDADGGRGVGEAEDGRPRDRYGSTQGRDSRGADEKVVLYLSRGEAAPRALVKETEAQLIAALQRLVEDADSGWRLKLWDDNADHQWQWDTATFARARIIVGPHGGALSNLIFANTTSGATTGEERTEGENRGGGGGTARVHVVEFIPRASLERPPTGSKGKGGDFRPCYLALAQALGIAYHHVEPRAFSFHRPHLDVNVDDVAATVRSIMHGYGEQA